MELYTEIWLAGWESWGIYIRLQVYALARFHQ